MIPFLFASNRQNEDRIYVAGLLSGAKFWAVYHDTSCHPPFYNSHFNVIECDVIDGQLKGVKDISLPGIDRYNHMPTLGDTYSAQVSGAYIIYDMMGRKEDPFLSKMFPKIN